MPYFVMSIGADGDGEARLERFTNIPLPRTARLPATVGPHVVPRIIYPHLHDG